jgi:hypothetical protein
MSRRLRRPGAGRAPGSVLIAVAAWLLELIGGALFVSFSAQYAYIHAIRRQDAIAPVALAVVVDRVVAVIHRHALAGAQPSAWNTVGCAAAATARITGLIARYCLRSALAAPETARGLRRIVLDAAPLPARPEPAAPEAAEPTRTKKAVLLALYRAHPDYGNRGTASRVAAELAPQAGLQAGTARSYLYAELDGGKA